MQDTTSEGMLPVGKGYTEPLCIIFAISLWVYNYFQIKSEINKLKHKKRRPQEK